MKPSLQLGLNQQLALTPQLQQAIRLLQMSTLDLQQEIQQIAESNPLLEVSPNEEETEASSSLEVTINYEPDNEWQWEQIYQSKRTDFQESSDNTDNLYSTTTSLHDHLLWQVNLVPLSDTDFYIAEAIIEGINDDGFLTVTLDDIREGLNKAVDLDEIEAIRHLIQHLDPVGCGSKDLVDCLLVQLPFYQKDHPRRELAENIIRNDLELLAQHNYRLLKKQHQITDKELHEAIQLIQQLHPKPGSQVQQEITEYIIPDVTIKKVNHQWQVFLNQHILPKLSINKQYAAMAKDNSNQADSQYIKANLQEARWFLKSIQSRQDTLLKVANCIMEHQKEFLEHGDVAMKPLILHDIAGKLGMHESTISRVTTQKFIHTPRGVYELKYFFSSHVNTENGGECSSTAIKAMIKQLISEESPAKPLSDSKIASIMADKGIHVARRTVAKYREAMGISPSNARKSIRC